MIARFVNNLRQPTSALPEMFDGLRNDYEATKNSRFNRRRVGLASGGAPGDYHFRSESQYYDLVERARDLDRNDSIVGQVIDRACSNIIQDGFTLIPQTGDDKLDLDLWQRWQAFAVDPDECDIAGEMTWCDYEFAAMRAMLVDGDCVITATDDGPLQFWESHTIRTDTKQKNTVLGIEIDKFRKRTHVWLATDDTNMRGKEKSRRIAMRNEAGQRIAFQIYRPYRVSLTRGVTAFARIFSVSGMLDDINFAELVKRQIASCFAVFREQAPTAAMSGLPGTDPGYGEATTKTTPAGTRQMDNVAPGMEITGRPGEKLSMGTPAVPNSEAASHFWQQISIIGCNLGLAPCQVLLDFSRENFVGYRGAIDEARKGFRVNQRNLCTRFHRPAYKQRIAYWAGRDPALANAFTRDGVNPLNHLWQPPSFKYVEPVNDAAGDLLRVRNGLTSRRRQQAEQGQDWETIAEESIADNAYAIEQAKAKAKELNAKYPDEPVSWRDLINLPTSDGIQVSLQTNPSGGTQPGTAKPGEKNNG